MRNKKKEGESTPRLYNERTFTVIGVILVLGVITANWSHDSRHEEAHRMAQQGPHDAAPDFRLNDIDGKPITLADYRGKWLFLNFWATWCEPCRLEMPSLQRLAESMGKENFALIGLHQGAIDIDEVRSFAAATGITFRLAIDGDDALARAYGVTSLPLSYLINPKGEIVAITPGAHEWDNPAIIASLRERMEAP